MANTIKVACKLPNGLIIDHDGHKHELAGANSSQLINGFGITDVDKEFFDKWLEANKAQKIVQNGIVFAVDHASKVEGATKERKGQKSGLEGLDHDKPTQGVKQEQGKE